MIDDVIEGDNGSRCIEKSWATWASADRSPVTFLPIGGDDEADDVDVGMGLEIGTVLDRRSCGGDIDDQHPIAVGQ